MGYNRLCAPLCVFDHRHLLCIGNIFLPLFLSLSLIPLTISIPSIAQIVLFQQPLYIVAEGAGDVTVIIMMSGVSTVDIILNIRTINGTATSMISINLVLTTSSCHISCSTNGL